MVDKALYNLLIDLRANTAQLQQDMDKAVGILQRSGGLMSKAISGVFQGFGQAIGREVLQNIGRLSTALTDLADAGDEAGGIAENFRKIGGTSESIDRAKKAVLGTVDAFDLMKVANEGVIRGLPDMNKNLALLAEYANRFADASGRDTVEVMNALTQAIGSGSNKALREFGVTVDEGASRSEKMTQALDQLRGNMEKLAPLGESVTQGHERLNAALEEARKNFGIAINDSAGLTEAYNALAAEIEKVDWHAVGEGVGFVTGQVANFAAEAVKALKPVAELVAGIQNMTQFAKAGMLAVDEMAVKTRMAMSLGGTAADKADLEKIQGEKMMSQLQGLLGTPQQAGRKLSDALGLTGGGGAPPAAGGGGAGGFGGGGGGGGSSAASEIDRLKEKWADLTTKIKQDSLKDAIDESIASLDVSGFDQLKTQLSDQVSQAFIDGNKEFLKAGVSMDELKTQAESVAAAQVREYQSKMDDALWKERQDRSKMVGDLAKEEADQRQKLMEYYGQGQGGIGSAWSLSLVSAAEAFGAEMSQQLATVFAQYSKQFDGMINQLVESATFLGSTMTTGQAHSMGIQGPGMENGQFGEGANYAAYAGVGLNVLASVINSSKTDKANKDNSGTGASIGMAYGAVLGGVFGGPFGAALGAALGNAAGTVIGGLFKWGPQNPNTRARHQFANWMEDGFEEKGALTVYGRDNRGATRLSNFIEGDSSRFNQPGWADEFNKDPNAKAFSGLGMALKELLGISEDVGSQIGVMLFQNLEGNVNNARMLMKKLGLSFEEVEGALVEIGLKGEKTWLEVEVGLQGASQAFGDGLVEVGAYGTAMQNLLDSGARGFEAVQSIRNIFTEAAEAGITNFDQLREQLLKTFDPTVVDAFFAAVNQRGVVSIEAGKSLDDRTAGGLVADMQALGVKFNEVGDQFGDAMGDLNSATSTNTSATMENTAALRSFPGWQPPADTGGEEEFASGGVVFGPTRALMGEAGPEAILPLTRKNGRMGVSLHGVQGGGGGYVVQIDARGAAPGVESRIRAAIRESESRIERSIFRSIDQRRRRAV